MLSPFKYLFPLFFVIATVTSTHADEPDKVLHQKCLYPTIRLERESGGGGTAVVVRSEKVGDKYHNVAISCAHVGNNNGPHIVKIPVYENWSELDRWEVYRAKVYAFDADRDLSIVLFESNSKLAVADLGFDEKLYIGSPVLKFGCGQGPEPRLDEGKITSLNKMTSGRYRTNIYVVSGDSGCPVYHNHKVIGIAVSIRMMNFHGNPTPLWNISNVVPITLLKTWDEEVNNVLGFVYKTKRRLPALPFAMLKMEEYVVVNSPIE